MQVQKQNIMERGYLIQADMTLSSAKAIYNATYNRLPDIITPKRDYHCTILLAKKWGRMLNANEIRVTSESYIVSGVECFDTGAVVLTLSGDHPKGFFPRRLELIGLLGAVPLRSSYVPHVTIGKIKEGSSVTDDQLNEIRRSTIGMLVHFASESHRIITL